MKRAGLTFLLIVVVVLVLAGVGYSALKKGNVLPGSIVRDNGGDVSDYSAVFLTNGQVYFGKITSITGAQVDITDIYYLQVDQQVQPDQKKEGESTSTNKPPNIALVKLGNELHGPNDLMHINRAHVIFIESLKKAGQVVKAIEDNKAKK